MLRSLLQHVWPAEASTRAQALKARVVASIALMVTAKVVTIYIPFFFKDLVCTCNKYGMIL